MNLTAVTIIFTIAALQSLLAGAAFFLMKENKGPRHPRLLSGLFLLIAMGFTDGAVETAGGYRQYPSFAFIANVFALGIPGMLYLYTRALILERFQFYKRDLFQASAVIFAGVVALFSYHLRTHAEKIAFWSDAGRDNLLQSSLVSNIILAIIIIQIVWLVRLLKRHRHALLQVRSNSQDQSYNFLIGFGIAYGGIVILNIILAVVQSMGRDDLLPPILLILGVWSYLMISALILAVTLWPEQQRPLSPEEADIAGFETTESESTDGIQEGENPHWNALETSLEPYIRQQQPYLDANLTLVQLARKLGVPGRELSAYINNRMKQNFSDYIADWRIDEAKAQLSAEHFNGSITDVMYSAGFNSKSVFNTHFRKRTGMTPSQWRSRRGAPLDSDTLE